MEILKSPTVPTNPAWTHSRTALHKFMLKTGFGFSTRQSYYEFTKERADVVVMRENFLLWIAKHRDEGFELWYQDETWANKNMSCKNVWQFENEVLYKVPQGVGVSCIISHIGSKEHGLLDGAGLVFHGKKEKENEDYHTDMNADLFYKWMDNEVFTRLSAIGKKCVCVLDRAKYHTPLT